MRMRLEELARLAGGTLQAEAPGDLFEGAVSIDSRASYIRFAMGLCTSTCLPFFIAAMEMVA